METERCTETHPTYELRCTRPADGHTWHRAEKRSTYSATDVLPWGRAEQPAAAPADPR